LNKKHFVVADDVLSTFVCPTEILAFNDRLDEFRAIGAEVRSILMFFSLMMKIVAASVDSVFTHVAWFVCMSATWK